MTRFKELCMDTTRSGAALGGFWAAVTGCSYAESSSATDTGDVVGPEEGMGIAICPVPEPKTVKNRIHWDLYCDVSTFVEAGGTVLAELPRWIVMADPEGNEFCVFPEPASGEQL